MDCLHGVFRQQPANQLQAIALDGTSGTMLLCSDTGEVLSPALMYDDSSSTAQLEKLKAPYDSPALSVTAGLPKAMQLAGVISGQSAWLQHQADWLTGTLCDHYGFSDENNALKTGYDVQQRCWPDWVRAALPDNVSLPEVMLPGQVIGHAGKQLQSLGVPHNTRIVAGTTDSTAAFLAAGAERMDQGCSTLGSTLVLKQLCRAPVTDGRRGIYSHRLGDAWLTGGASNTGGKVLAQYFTSDEIARLSRHLNWQQDTGLDYYPLSQPGERFPVNDPQQQPCLTPRPPDDGSFLQAMMEGIARIESRGYQILNSLGTVPIKEVISSGGGSVNETWNHIRQRILGVPVKMAVNSEAAFGVARLARQGTTLFDAYS